MTKKSQDLEMPAFAMRYTFLAGLVLLAAASRVFQPMSNFTAMGALAVVSALFAPRAAYAFLFTGAGMLLGDLFLSLSNATVGLSPDWSSYVGFGLVVALGLAIRTRPSIWKAVSVSLAGGLVFFFFSNGVVWVRSAFFAAGNSSDSMGSYSADLAGLTECYVNAIPFYRPMLLGDLLYVPLFYGSMVGLLALEHRFAAKKVAQQEN